MEAPSSAPGISFLCQSVVANEDSFGIFAVDGITEPHPFHVVYTSNINAKHYAQPFLGSNGKTRTAKGNSDEFTAAAHDESGR